MPPIIIPIFARVLIVGAVALVGAIGSALAVLRVEGDRQRDEEERKRQNKNTGE
jgi:hypothetical protein